MKILENLGGVVAKRPWWMVIGAVLITFILLGIAGWSVESERSEIRTNINAMFPKYEEVDQLEGINEDFGNAEIFLILVKADDVLEPDVITRSNEAISRLYADNETYEELLGDSEAEKQASMVSVGIILGGYRFSMTGAPGLPTLQDSLSWSNNFTSRNEVRITIENYLSDPFVPQVEKDYIHQLLPTDTDLDEQVPSMIMMVLLDGTMTEIEMEEVELHMRDDIINDVRGEGVSMYVYAFGILSASYLEAEAAAEPLMMLAMMGVFILSWINYRRLSDVLIANGTLVLIMIWTFAIVGVLGFDYNFMNFMVPVLMIGLGIDFSFHAIIGYRERLAGEGDGKERIKKAMRSMSGVVGVALILATITTAFGFFSNVTSDIPTIIEFGILAGLGIIFSCLLNLTFAPAIRVILDMRRVKKGKELKGVIAPENISPEPGRLLKPLSFTVKHPWTFIVVLMVLAVPGYIAASGMRATYDPTGELLDTMEVTKAFRTMNSDYSVGTETIYIRVDGDFEDPMMWDLVYSAIDNASDNEYVHKVEGKANIEWIGSFLGFMGAYDGSYQFVDEDMDGRVDPDADPQKLSMMLDNLSLPFGSLMEQYIHKGSEGFDGVVLRVKSNTNIGEHGFRARDELVEDFAGVEDNADRVVYTGEPIIWNKGLDDFNDSLMTSTLLVLLFAVILLTLVFGILHRSPVLGLVTSLLPIAVIGWTLGGMYITNIPLNMMTAFVGSFTVGLGIDYPIHLVTRWAEERKKGGSIIGCYTISLKSTGRELLFSAATTLFAFIAFALMPMPVMREFGFVMLMGISFSFLGAVIMMPMLMRIWHRTDQSV